MIRINLLGRDQEAEKKRSLALPDFPVGGGQVGMAALFVVVLAGILIAWWSQTRRITDLRGNLAEVQADRARLQDVADEVRALQARTDLLKQKMQVIVELKANQTGPVMLLDQISRLLTDSVWLTNLEADSDRVTVRGGTLSEVGTADFVENLENSRFFDDVVLRSLVETGDALSFEVTLTFIANPGAPPEDAPAPAGEEG